MKKTEMPAIMAILNLTPDSFAVQHGNLSLPELVKTAETMVEEGAGYLDLGAQSTRPGYQPISIDEEWSRLEPGLSAIRKALPDIPISIDTFYAEIARRAIDHGADIINDVTGGADPEMISYVARARVPYIYTYTDQQSLANPPAQLTEIEELIIDPGFGFGKTLEDNYSMLRSLQQLKQRHPGCLLLAGISRKSMIWRPCECTPTEALPGTIAANMAALIYGADILRVHDVAAAKQTITVYQQLQLCSDLNLESKK